MPRNVSFATFTIILVIVQQSFWTPGTILDEVPVCTTDNHRVQTFYKGLHFFSRSKAEVLVATNMDNSNISSSGHTVNYLPPGKMLPEIIRREVSEFTRKKISSVLITAQERTQLQPEDSEKRFKTKK